MTNKILTIAIPTYNRSHELSNLIAHLAKEIDRITDNIEIIVYDNASTDGTHEVLCSDLIKNTPAIKIFKQTQNVGMDLNFISCVSKSKGKYIWILSDDDLPTAGSIQLILKMLNLESPDLVYLNNLWSEAPYEHASKTELTEISYSRTNAADFETVVNINLTFLSSAIFKNTSFIKGEAILKYRSTNLSQLSWVIDRLINGSTFIHVNTTCIHARNNNSGGYSLFDVFGKNFVDIIRTEYKKTDALKSRGENIIRLMKIYYLPFLIWNYRVGRLKGFSAKTAYESISYSSPKSLHTWLIIKPLTYLPMRVSRLFMLLSKIIRSIHFHIKLAKMKKKLDEEKVSIT
jgi:abequosyltransferase